MTSEPFTHMCMKAFSLSVLLMKKPYPHLCMKKPYPHLCMQKHPVTITHPSMCIVDCRKKIVQLRGKTHTHTLCFWLQGKKMGLVFFVFFCECPLCHLLEPCSFFSSFFLPRCKKFRVS